VSITIAPAARTSIEAADGRTDPLVVAWCVLVVDLIVVLVSYIAMWPRAPNKSAELAFFTTAFLLGPPLSAIAAPRLARSVTCSRFLPTVASALSLAALAFASISLVPILTVERPIFFGCGFLGALTLMAIEIVVRPKASGLMNTILVVVSFAGLLSLFDSRLSMESLSYGPYLGPALRTLHGGAPLVDTFSQYGLSFVLFAAIIWASDYSFQAIVGFVSAINIAMFLIFGLIALRMLGGRAIPFLMMAISVVAIVQNYPFDITYNPSVFGVRFLPLFMLAATLIISEYRGGWLQIVTIALCSIWSFETFAFGMILLGTFFLVTTLTSGGTVVRAISRAATAPMAFLLAQLVLSAIWLAVFHSLPRYGPYLELVRSYTDLTPGYWAMPIEPGFRAWLLHVVAYSSALGLCLLRATEVRSTSPRSRVALACVAALGILQFSYYAGRSTLPLLIAMSLPLLFLTVYVFHATARLVGDGIRSPTVITPLCCTMIVLAAVSGSAVAKLARPLDLSPTLPSGTFTASNDILLSACFQSAFHRCIPEFGRMARPTDLFADHVGGQFFEQAKQAYGAAKAFEATQGRVHALITDTSLLMFFQRSAPEWGLSNPINDGLSEWISSRAVDAALADVRDGDFLIIAKDPPLFPLSADTLILKALRSRHTLCPIDAAAYPSVEIARVTGGSC
jgi:hypothetical protein